MRQSSNIGNRAGAVGSFVAASLLSGTAAHGGVFAVDSSFFGAGTTVVTFSEVANGSTIPFTVGLANFVGLAGLVADTPGVSAPPAPSGGQYLYSGSVKDQDYIEVLLGEAQEAVGAYFNVLGGGGDLGLLVMEFYSGETLLGSLLATPEGGTAGGFIGGSAGGAVIDRVIFRDIDDSVPISFRIDDFQFVPAPGAIVFLVAPFLGLRMRRRS